MKNEFNTLNEQYKIDMEKWNKKYGAAKSNKKKELKR